MSLSNKVKTAIMAGVLAVAGAGASILPTYAAPTNMGGISGGMNNVANAGNLDKNANVETTINNVINIFLYVVGVLAVVMIIVGGVQYTTSAGDQAKVTKAKNTILYGIIGLAVAVLAYAIVNFVLTRITNH